MLRRIIFSIALTAIIIVSPVYSQEHQTNETSWEVKELSDFHDVIYQLWHTAWPTKDIKMLKSLAPELTQGYEILREAKLPGILRDKQKQWNDNIAKLGIHIDQYHQYCINTDSVNLLQEAENVHSMFEYLVRTIRPVLKEVEAFHKVLYMIYHYYIPEYNYAKINESIVELKTKLDELNNASLPDRLKSKEEIFSSARQNLSDAAEELITIVNEGDDKEKIITAVDKMHSKYQALEKVFE